MCNLPMCGIARDPEHTLNQEALQLTQEAHDHEEQAIQDALEKKEQKTDGTLQEHNMRETHALQSGFDDLTKKLAASKSNCLELYQAQQAASQTLQAAHPTASTTQT